MRGRLASLGACGLKTLSTILVLLNPHIACLCRPAKCPQRIFCVEVLSPQTQVTGTPSLTLYRQTFNLGLQFIVEHVVAQETTIRATHRHEVAVASATAFPIPIIVWICWIFGSARGTCLIMHYFIAAGVGHSFTGTLVPAIPTPVLGRPAVLVDSLNQSTPAHIVFAVAEDSVAIRHARVI